MDRDLLIVILTVVFFFINIPFYLYLGKRFFENWKGFVEAIDFWFTPNIVSALKGKFHDDIWTELKLWIFFVICLMVLAFEYTCIHLWVMSGG